MWLMVFHGDISPHSHLWLRHVRHRRIGRSQQRPCENAWSVLCCQPPGRVYDRLEAFDQHATVYSTRMYPRY